MDSSLYRLDGFLDFGRLHGFVDMGLQLCVVGVCQVARIGRKRSRENRSNVPNESTGFFCNVRQVQQRSSAEGIFPVRKILSIEDKNARMRQSWRYHFLDKATWILTRFISL